LLWHVSEKMDLQPANEVETTQLDKIENLIDKGLEY